MKSIFDYNNFRVLVQDQFDSLKVKHPSLTHRKFCKEAGFRSPSFLLGITRYEKKIDLQSAFKLGHALKLNATEVEFFLDLVQYNQATSIAEQQKFFRRLNRSKNTKSDRKVHHHKYQFISTWYCSAIFEFINSKSYDGSNISISKAFEGRVSQKEISHALSLMEKLGLAAKDPSGRYHTFESDILTPDEESSHFIFRYHENMLKIAQEALRRDPETSRFFAGTTFKISKEKVPQLKKMLTDFHLELCELLQHTEKADSVYQINLQLFSLTKVLK